MSNYPDDFPHHLLDGEDKEKENTCEHEEFELDSEEADVEGKMTLTYICYDCGAIGQVIYQIGAIQWKR